MKFISLKSASAALFAAVLFFSSCSKEEDSAFLTPNSTSSMTTSSQSGGVTPMVTLQDFQALGTLTVNTNPTYEPNAANYGYYVMNFTPNPGVIAEPITIYHYDSTHPNAGNTPPANSPLYLGGSNYNFWEAIWKKTDINFITRIKCLGSGSNCASEHYTDDDGDIAVRVIVKTAP